MNDKDLQALIDINNSINAPETEQAVSAAKIDNPVKAVEDSLTKFVTSQFERIESSNDFQNLVRLHLRQRMSEASYDQLLQLDDQLAKNNTAATETVLNLFKNESSGKVMTDYLKDESIENSAQQLYDSADNKKVLQAVSYLSQVMSKLQSQEAEVKENGNN